MTIAQHKVKKYCYDNRISMLQLSKQLGYHRGYVGELSRGAIPHKREMRTIEETFNIVNEYSKIKEVVKGRYSYLTKYHDLYKSKTGHNICYNQFNSWVNGIIPNSKTCLKNMSELFNVKNEWVEDYE